MGHLGFGLNCRMLIAALAVAVVAAGPAFAGSGPEGVWRLTSGKVTVRVSYCAGHNLCATIVGLAKPLDKAGKPKTDHENPNRALRARRVIGLQVASGLVATGENRWKGRIYNADDGGTYRSEMRLDGNTMVLEGCWGPFCKKNRFIRVR